MPKTKISEFSATAGNNTDIDGINISEGCPPSGINDAIRELMAQLKDFQAGTAGDSFNGPIGTTTPAAGVFTNLSASGTFALTGDQVQISEGGTGQTTANAAFNALAPSQSTHAGKYLKTDGTNTSWDALDISTADITGTLPVANGGTGVTSSTGTGSVVLSASPTFTGTVNGAALTLSSNFTLSGGTANGVAYLNGSKVLTTGSALVFDGTNLKIGASSLTAGFLLDAQGASRFGSNSGAVELNYNAGTFTASVVSYDRVNSAYRLLALDGSEQVFRLSNSEAMRLTSTGLGIGTSNPAYKLMSRVTTSASVGVAINLDASGNSNGDGSAIRFSRADNIISGVAQIEAVKAEVSNNETDLIFKNYSGSSLAERMRIIGSSGNVGIGTSSPGQRLTVAGNEVAAQKINAVGTVYASGAFLNAFSTAGGNEIGFSGFIASQSLNTTNRLWMGVHSPSGANQSFVGTPDATPLAFWTNSVERMRITSAGMLGLGTTTPNKDGGSAITLTINSSSGGRLELAQSETRYAQMYAGSSGAYITAYTAIPLIFEVNGAERMRISSAGDVSIGTTSTTFGGNTQRFSVSGAKTYSEGQPRAQLVVSDSTAQAAGVGGAVMLVGVYDGSGNTTGFASVEAAKENGTSGNYAGALVLKSRSNGGNLTERARFNSTGALVLAGGTTTADGIGITFPATQSASTDANTLDDYEEGTWTPTLSASVTAPTISAYTTRAGQYTKIGNIVTVFCHLYVNISNAGAGYPIISGLPFNVASNTQSGISLGKWSAFNSIIPLQAAVFDTSGVYFESSSYVTGNNLYVIFSATYRT